MSFDRRETAAILAGLRLYQAVGEGRKSVTQSIADIEDIASNGDEFRSLESPEIDELCERINLGPANAEAELAVRRAAWWAEGESLGLYPIIAMDTDDIKESSTDAGHEANDEAIIEAIGYVAELDWSDTFGEIRNQIEERIAEQAKETQP